MYNRRPAEMVGVAQLVERRIVIPVVVGSNPIVHPIFRPDARFRGRFGFEGHDSNEVESADRVSQFQDADGILLTGH